MNSVIATTPAGMLAAQTQLQTWIDAKIVAAKRDLSNAESVYNALHKAKLRTQTASNMIRKARLRISFYEKITAAIAAGYYLIPPFEVQLFAIRTKKDSPAREEAAEGWSRDQQPQAIPIGIGEYKNPVVGRIEIATRKETRPDGSIKNVTVYKNDDWAAELELPVRAMKPEIIEATHQALGLKIFDALGIAPAYRSSDPIIVGQILHWKQNHSPLTFFIAWWTDEQDL